MAVGTECDIARLPWAMTGFSDIRQQGNIYVDKTALIYELARQRGPFFLSRPRRFGKSLLVDTLHSLFSRGLEDFRGLAIDGLWQDRTYRVVRIDFSRMADKEPREFEKSLRNRILYEFGIRDKNIALDITGECRPPEEITGIIADDLANNSTVLLIDEYDAPLTHHLDKPDELQSIVQILNNFYATVKEYTSKFRFIFITGITRIAHISIFSAFNNLDDISFYHEYNSLLGFTKDELVLYFDDYIVNAAKILGMSKKDVYVHLEQVYDGFQFAIDAKETLFNPWSILKFLKRPGDGFQNYWYQSGGISSLLVNYLKVRDNFDFLNIEDRSIITDKSQLEGRYELSAVPREILLCQAGYLTVRNCDGELRLVPPNGEVEASLLYLYMTANNRTPQIALGTQLKTLVGRIDGHDITGIVDVFNATLNYVVSPLSKVFTDERAVRDTLFGSLQQVLHLQLFKERESLDGYCDMEMLTPKTRLIVEFKRTYPKGEKGKKPRDAKTSLAEAVAQIESHHYGESPFSVQTLFRVAMVISTEEKRILPEYCREVR